MVQMRQTSNMNGSQRKGKYGQRKEKNGMNNLFIYQMLQI